MDWISEVDWGAIISAAAASPLGIVALALIVGSFLVSRLFSDAATSAKHRLTALIIFFGGIIALFLAINPTLSSELRRLDALEAKELAETTETLRLDSLLASCIGRSNSVSHSCRARDQSGFHSSPSASCVLTIRAPTGQFFAKNQVEVQAEHYRNIRGASAINAVKPQNQNVAGISVATSFAGSIGCTNAQGTGRTCESSATIKQLAYPNECIEVLHELRND